MKYEIVINANLPQLAESVTREIGDLAMQITQGIEAEAKRLIQQSIPAGRTYRRRAIQRQANRGLLALGLRRSKSDATRVVAGYRFHRASAKGQPPANDSRTLVNSIRAKRTGRISAEVDVGAGHAGFLEPPAKLDRPFLTPAIEFTLERVLTL